MKIKVALLDKDKEYLDRLTGVFNTKYADKLEVYSFTDEKNAIESVKGYRIDVLIAEEDFNIDKSEFKRNCGLAYFTGTPGIELIKDEIAICKYQRVDVIFKQILGVYSDMAANVATISGENDKSSVVIFTSPCGGVGTSTVAAACAIAHANMGKRVFYLNLEQCGTTDVFFQAEGNATMSDVIYSLKSRKANLLLKLESCIKQSQEGVSYFSSTKVALDILEISYADIDTLIGNIQGMDNYDEIIVDLPFSLEIEKLKLLSKAWRIIVVNDGSQLSNYKFMRAYESVVLLEQNDDINIIRNMNMIYNKFSNKNSEMLSNISIKTIGGAPRYEHATVRQIIEALTKMEFFEEILQ